MELCEAAARACEGKWDGASALWIRPQYNLRTDMPLFVIDWDNTLMPSDWAIRVGAAKEVASDVEPRRNAPEAVRRRLQACGESAARLLDACLGRGNVVIVSNCFSGWFWASAASLVPEVLGPLSRCVGVMFATEATRLANPDPAEWKRANFELALRRVRYAEEGGACSARPADLVCIGDGAPEREATARIASEFDWVRARFVPVICASGAPEELVAEHARIIAALELE